MTSELFILNENKCKDIANKTNVSVRTIDKKTNTKKRDTNVISEGRMTTFIKPLMPVYMGDLRLIPTKRQNKPNAETEPKKKKKRRIKARICPHCGLLTKSLNSHILRHIGRFDIFLQVWRQCCLCSPNHKMWLQLSSFTLRT